MIWINALFPKQLTKNFHETEILDKSKYDGTGFNFDERVVNIAQFIRDNTGKPVNINSAYRIKWYNDTIDGSAENSQHIYGKALDLSGAGVVEFMRKAFDERNANWYHMITLGLNGIGFYNSFIHIDTRSGKFASWGEKKSEVQNYFLILIISFLAIFGFKLF